MVYIEPPKALQKAVQQLKRRSVIVITKPINGSGVVVMDGADYVRLLHDAPIKDTSEFIPVSKERPKQKGHPRPNTITHYWKKNNNFSQQCGKYFPSLMQTRFVAVTHA